MLAKSFLEINNWAIKLSINLSFTYFAEILKISWFPILEAFQNGVENQQLPVNGASLSSTEKKINSINYVNLCMGGTWFTMLWAQYTCGDSADAPNYRHRSNGRPVID